MLETRAEQLWNTFPMRKIQNRVKRKKTCSKMVFFWAEEDSDFKDSEAESDDGGIDEVEVDELQREAAIARFNAILIEAQEMAVKAKKEAAGKKTKWKQHYTGNSQPSHITSRHCNKAQKRV